MLASKEPILHLTSPRPVAWNDIFTPIADQLGVPLVSFVEWLERLRGAARQAEEGGQTDMHDSAFNLLDFFEATMSGRETLCSTDESVRAARALDELQPIGKEDVSRWLSFWEHVGFLSLK